MARALLQFCRTGSNFTTRLVALNRASVYNAVRLMATEKTIKTPSMGESITEGTLTQWHKSNDRMY